MAIKDLDEACKTICKIMIDDQSDFPCGWSEGWIIQAMFARGYSFAETRNALAVLHSNNHVGGVRRPRRMYDVYRLDERQYKEAKQFRDTQ